MKATYTLLERGIKCHFCEKVSHNTNDILNLYCGHCQFFHCANGQDITNIDEAPTQHDMLFQDSPDAGHKDCKCSRCAQVIERTIAIRMWTAIGGEYRYHPKCLNLMTSENDDDDDDD